MIEVSKEEEYLYVVVVVGFAGLALPKLCAETCDHKEGDKYSTRPNAYHNQSQFHYELHCWCPKKQSCGMT